MRIFKRISALALGSVLFLAGLLKLMDPVGAGLQMEAYFRFLHIGFLNALAVPASVAFALFETVVGAAVLTGFRRRLAGIVSFVLLVFFTVLTFVIWIANPDMECGCFGEAIHMTHGQSLVKNLVLMALWAAAFLPRGMQEDTPNIKRTAFWTASVSSALFLAYSLFSLPLVDFTSLKPGAELEGETSVAVFDGQGESRDSLLVNGRVIVISVYDADKLSSEDWLSISRFAGTVEDSGLRPLLLVSGDPDEVPADSSLMADHRALMTLNRSNGGATYVADGQVIKKWPSRSLPEKDDLECAASDNPMEALVSSTAPGRLKLQGFLLYVFAVMLLL